MDAAVRAQNKIQPYIDYFFYDKEKEETHWQEICKNTLQVQGLDAVLPRKPLGALTLHGLQAGPQLFTEHADTVYTIFTGMLIANAMVLIVGLLFIRLFLKAISIKPYILTSIIFLLCVMGSFAIRNNFFDVIVMLIAGFIGYFLTKLEIPPAPIVLAMILGPMAESNLRRALLLSKGSYMVFFTRPICLLFLGFALFSILWPYLRSIKRKPKKIN